MLEDAGRATVDEARGYANEAKFPVLIEDSRNTLKSLNETLQLFRQTLPGATKSFIQVGRGSLLTTAAGQGATAVVGVYNALNQAQTSRAIADAARVFQAETSQRMLYGSPLKEKAGMIIRECAEVVNHLRSSRIHDRLPTHIKFQFVGEDLRDQHIRDAAASQAFPTEHFFNARKLVHGTLQQAIDQAGRLVPSAATDVEKGGVLCVFLLTEDLDLGPNQQGRAHEIKVPHSVVDAGYYIVAHDARGGHAIALPSTVEATRDQWLPFHQHSPASHLDDGVRYQAPEEHATSGGARTAWKKTTSSAAAGGTLGALGQWGLAFHFALPHSAAAVALVAPGLGVGAFAGGAAYVAYWLVSRRRTAHDVPP